MIMTRTSSRETARFRGTGLRCLALCTLTFTLCACSTSLRVDSSFPRPLVTSLPIDVGIYYDETLRQYAFEKEADANSVAWNIELGAAHVRLFNQLFQPLFENLTHLDALSSDSAARPVTVIMRPSIDEYTLSTPGDTATDFYAVEIRYKLSFYSPSGDFIQGWAYSGRGRSRSELFSTDESVQKATVAAMRDAAAWLVIELSKQPDFHRRLQAQQSDDANSLQDHDS